MICKPLCFSLSLSVSRIYCAVAMDNAGELMYQNSNHVFVRSRLCMHDKRTHSFICTIHPSDIAVTIVWGEYNSIYCKQVSTTELRHSIYDICTSSWDLIITNIRHIIKIPSINVVFLRLSVPVKMDGANTKF